MTRPAFPHKPLSMGGRLRRAVLGIAEVEATGSRRGFHGGTEVTRRHLDRIGRTFLTGYHAALEDPDSRRLGARLDDLEAEFRGFAYEGAAMALALLDALLPGRRSNLRAFLEGPGDSHVYMVHVGAGWASARLPGNPERALRRRHPILGWLALDGYGFHQGFFHAERFIGARAPVTRLSPDGRRVFDQGLGRSLWFVEGAEPEHIARTIDAFPQTRQADLWSGVGLACTYAGGVDETVLRALVRGASRYRPEAAQGAAFAAKARLRAGNLLPHTESACRVLCGLSAEEAARVADEVYQEVSSTPLHPGSSAYALWRQGIQQRFTREARVA